MVSSNIAKEVTNYTYDTLGNLVLETVKNKSVDYEYNELNQLVKRTTSTNDTYTYSYDTVYYRVYDGSAGKIGSYMSATPQNGALQSQLDLALNPEWGNTAQNVTKVYVPAGTEIFAGTAAPQVINGRTGVLPGGGSQIYIPEVDPSWFHN